ncbi:hypothetical protein ACFPA8_07830 [Streptomyces ovatisporus]|uniref:Uncharacterized protein n=1 Tax=Streptomyces ovatisporus TaxID=1128682 RepID=A0ABV9A504_9ACTN
MPIHADINVCVRELPDRMESEQVADVIRTAIEQAGYKDVAVDIVSTFGSVD